MKKSELVELYKKSFDDLDQEVEFFFDNYFLPRNTVTHKINRKIVSALHLVTKKMFLRGKTFNFSYVSAAATLPDLRGKRIMEKVIYKALNLLYARRTPFVVLSPFSFTYYTKYDFTRIQVNSKPQTAVQQQFSILNDLRPSFLLSCYEQYCKNFDGYIIRDLARYTQLLSEWKVSNFTINSYKLGLTNCYVCLDRLGHLLDYSGDVSSIYPSLASGLNTPDNWDLMVRIVNVKYLLKHIKYDSCGSYNFYLTDNFFPLNNGYYKLIVSNSNTKISFSHKEDKNTTFTNLTVEELTKCVFGNISLTELLKTQKLFVLDKY
ncbi:MAG: GNAT family N-acetyltransferase [Clostridia bacterium]